MRRGLALNTQKAGYFLVSLLTLGFLTGCASFNTFKEKLARPERTFQVHNRWTGAASAEPNLGYRRLNRSTPTLISTEKGERLIVGNPYNGVQAFDPKSGRVHWRYPFRHGTETRITAEGAYIFVAANDGFIYGLEGESGNLLWSFPTRTENTAELVVSQGIVFVVTSQNTLFALEALTGKRLWIYTRPDSSLFSIRGSGRPVVHQGNLYVGFGDGALLAFKANSGQILWERNFGLNKRFRDLDSDLLVSDKSLFVGGFDDAVYKLELSSGSTQWRREGGMYGAFALNGKYLCFASPASQVECLDSSEGSLLYTYQLKSGIATGPIFYKGLLTFGESEGAIKWVDIKEQAVRAHFYPGRGLVAQPLGVEKENMVYFVSNESYVYAMEAKWAH